MLKNAYRDTGLMGIYDVAKQLHRRGLERYQYDDVLFGQKENRCAEILLKLQLIFEEKVSKWGANFKMRF